MSNILFTKCAQKMEAFFVRLRERALVLFLYSEYGWLDGSVKESRTESIDQIGLAAAAVVAGFLQVYFSAETISFCIEAILRQFACSERGTVWDGRMKIFEDHEKACFAKMSDPAFCMDRKKPEISGKSNALRVRKVHTMQSGKSMRQ